jgi:TRAP-type C4-dicarboxylate transport system permease small subunit
MTGWINLIERSEQVSLRSSRWLALCGLAALLLIAIMVTADVLMRWFANAPIEGVRDISGVAIAVAVSASLPTVLAKNENVTIRFVGRIFGPRTSGILDAFGSTVVLVVMTIMAWQFLRFSNEIAEAGDRTLILRVPLAPWWYVSTVIVMACVPVQIIVVACNVVRAVQKWNSCESDEGTRSSLR